MKREYEFHWMDGKIEVGKGTSEADAFTHLGYGAGALKALDFVKRIHLKITRNPAYDGPMGIFTDMEN